MTSESVTPANLPACQQINFLQEWKGTGTTSLTALFTQAGSDTASDPKQSESV